MSLTSRTIEHNTDVMMARHHIRVSRVLMATMDGHLRAARESVERLRKLAHEMSREASDE